MNAYDLSGLSLVLLGAGLLVCGWIIWIIYLIILRLLGK